MKHLLIWAFLALAAPVNATPVDDVIGPSIERMESGVICPPPTVGTRPAPNTITGFTNVIEEQPPFVSTNNRVPAVMGIGFGVKAQSIAPAGLGDVTMTVSHPPMGDAGTQLQAFQTSISGDDLSITFYQFDYAYELVIGTWTMTATIGDTVLYQSTFEVVPPQMVPELASICGFENLLS